MKYDFYYHTNVLSNEECETIRSNVIRDIDDSWNDSPAHGVIKSAKTTVVQWNKAKSYLSKVEDLAHLTNENYFGFSVNKYHDFSTVNYNEYSSGCEYGWHSDALKSESCSDIKLTVIVNITTEPYSGGEFQLFLNQERTISSLNAPGSVIVFPSWIQHRVTPVTSGIRKSLSFWIIGPKFI
jgi:PKHD-type hydroxylase